MHTKLKYKYFVLFFILQIVLLFALNFVYSFVSEKQIQNYISNASVKYHATVNTFQVLTDTFYDTQSKFIASTLSKITENNATQNDTLRNLLLDELNYFYINEKLRNMEVFHIFEKDGKSFLRFHKQDKFGDKIYLQRYSIRNMRDKKIAQAGLEIGVWKESYRFQYPLFYNGEFVGMFEYGMGFEEIINEMKKVFGGQYLYILQQKNVNAIINQSTKEQRFSISNLDNNYYTLKSVHYSYAKENLIKNLRKSKTLHEKLDNKTKKAFVIPFSANYEPYTAIFLPIKDILGTHAAYLIFLEKGNYLNILYTIIFVLYILSTLIIVGVLYYIFQVNKNSEFVSTILNSQDDMIILTDGVNLQSTNNATLDFFHYRSFDSFTRSHKCVCDFFIEEKGFLYSKKNNTSWLQHILNNPFEHHKVKMYSLNNRRDEIFLVKCKNFEDSNHFIITFSNITQNEILKNKLSYKANHDPLTKLYNRNYFNIYLEKAFSNAQRNGNNFSLIMFDIDYFKHVNDNYGHDVGDKVLIQIASIVENTIRKGDVLARWGGEEFMLIVMEDTEHAVLLAQKLRVKIQDHKFANIGSVTCSFGVTKFKKRDTFDSLIKRVDEKLYMAKESGRNRVIAD